MAEDRPRRGLSMGAREVFNISIGVFAMGVIFAAVRRDSMYRELRELGLLPLYNKLARATGRPQLRPVFRKRIPLLAALGRLHGQAVLPGDQLPGGQVPHVVGRKQRLGLSEYLPDALDSVKVRNNERTAIAKPDFDRLVAYLTPNRPHMVVTDLRTRALFFYLLYSAARVSEVLQVTRSEIEKAMVYQKGGTTKVLYVPEDAVRFVEDYLAARDDDCPWLWVTHQTNTPLRRLHPDGVRDIWRRLTKRIGIPYFTTHQIRHTYATLSRKAGIDRDTRQHQLGHADPRMMERYDHWDDEDREAGGDLMQAYVRRIASSTPRPRLRERLKKRRGGR